MAKPLPLYRLKKIALFMLMFIYFFELQQRAQKCDRFFIHILSCRFNPVRSQPQTVLDF